MSAMLVECATDFDLALQRFVERVVDAWQYEEVREILLHVSECRAQEGFEIDCDPLRRARVMHAMRH